ncbi:S8 family serine peptidase [Candidatus Poribacteria bacterium]|nr:S8 family serine peptidase [Candidatus Poribacteria bacterium]MYI94911.1 S8 family serine peptidase [Candidatus Poribacteria bacterium]
MHISKFRYINIPIYLFLIACLINSCIIGVNATPPEFTPGELLVRLTPEASMELDNLKSDSAVARFFAEQKVASYKRAIPLKGRLSTYHSNIDRAYLLRFSLLADLATLKTTFGKSDYIEAVSLNCLRPTLADAIVPNDPKYAEQWSLPAMKLPEAWTIEKGNKNVVIAIVDSGIDYRHDDLANKIWVNQDEIPDNEIDDDENGYVDDIHGWDFTDAPNLQAEGDSIEDDNEPIDESGHGTHVAGIAGALPDNGIGIAGVAWNCSLMAVRAGLSLGGGSRMQDDDSAAAIVYAADNGADIINMSWGSKQQSFVIRDAVEYAYARGVVLIGAAGNSNEDESIFPAAYRKVIAVASTNQFQQRFYRSNYGASVDIGAPGNGIISTQIDNGYRILTGTSMAAPHVAGVAALMLSKRPALTHEEIRQILINTADSVPEEDSEVPDPKFVGAGTVNAYRALLASSALQARILSPETHSGESSAIVFNGTAGGYKFKSWQLLYGHSSTPTTFAPINEPVSQQKSSETLFVWDIIASTMNFEQEAEQGVVEGVYTVRLEVTGRDGSKTHDQVVLTIDRSPAKIYSITAKETLYKNQSSTIISWATDDLTQGTFYYRRHGAVHRFASIEESGLSKEHIFSLSLGQGKYQFYIEAQNSVGLKSVDNNNGKYYQIDVVDWSISPHGFVETHLISAPLQLANVSTDFDKDGLYELIGRSLTDSPESKLTADTLTIYERLPTGKYIKTHVLDSTFSHENIPAKVNNSADYDLDLSTLIPMTVGDTDNDGLLEILVYDKKQTYLIESMTADGYPSKVIWETPYLSGGWIADLDGDGKTEIVGTDNNNNRILIFENIGNNTYSRTAALPNESEGKNIYSKDIAIDDFNSDGLLDFVVGDSEGELFVYSAIADDQYRLHIIGNTLTPMITDKINVDAVLHLSSGDLNGDGQPEIVVGGIESLPDVPSAPPLWKFQVLRYEFGKYRAIWEQMISPYRISGNSIKVVDLDGDNLDELVIIAFPNLYVMKWDGTAFIPIYHQEIDETSTLLSADMNSNGFQELFVNSEGGLSILESANSYVGASDRHSVVYLTPWNVSASPVTSESIEITWNAPKQENSNAVFTVYRALGSKNEEPIESDYKATAHGLTAKVYIDRNVETDRTYWYAISAASETGDASYINWARSKAVSATPRPTPKILSTVFQQPNWVIITYDRRMGLSIGNEQRYILRLPNQLRGIQPQSAIRDRMGTRALLGFDSTSLQKLIDINTDVYEVVISDVADTDDNKIRSAVSSVNMKTGNELPHYKREEVKDFTKLRVFPNPVQPNLSDKGAITFDYVPVGTSIKLFTHRGELLENLNVTESDGNSKEWWLTNGGIGDIATGIYIYILEYESHRKVGKIAVIK